MKICGSCKQEKSLDCFSRKGTKTNGEPRFQSKCKQCNRDYQRTHYRENRSYYSSKSKLWKQNYRRNTHSFLKQKCVDGCVVCGEKDYRCLQFNHIDPEQKQHEISRMVAEQMPLSRIETELEKCEVVCANCHCKITADQQGWYS